MLYRILIVCVFAMIGTARAEDCPSQPLATLPMVRNDLGTPMVSILIDGQPHDVLLDTGGFWSLISPSFAKLYGSWKSRVEGNLGLDAIKLTRAIKVPSIQIGSMKIADVDFFEEPEGYTSTGATLGANWLSRVDVEIDPLGKQVGFYPASRCGADVVRWPHSDFAELPVRIDRTQNLITIPMILDGREVRALIDTGSPETFLSLATARRLFDFDPDRPGTRSAEPYVDSRGKAATMYRQRFETLRMGGITFEKPWLVIAPMAGKGRPDIILGMHDLGSLHLYFAYRASKLYATTARGDAAARQAHTDALPVISPGGPVDLTAARDYLITASEALKHNDYDGAQAALDSAVRGDPANAQAYLQRGELFSLRGRRDLALADFDQALKLDPKDASAFLERSEVYNGAGDGDRAMADAVQGMRLEPNSAVSYAVRAEAYAAKGVWDRAMQDAIAAIRRDPGSIVGYLTRSHVYELTGDYPHAFEDADRAVHLEPQSATALNSRCWNGAILARLDTALADCDAAVALHPYSAEILDSRAFVHLQAGHPDAALIDYRAALAINPRFASSLYGQGLAKQRMGDAAGAAVDTAAATAIDAEIAGHFGK